jgi:hypothetical protein
MENFELVLEKCKNIWFDLEKRKRIRRKEGLFTDYDLDVIDKKINWINREKDNIKEKVMYMAHEIFEPPFCSITKEKISCYNPLYRNYTDEMIKNKCFIISKKIKQKMLFPFYEDYSKEELEKILKKIPHNVAVRYPMIINHCWISLKEKGINIDLIESNEEAFYLHTKNITEIPVCEISGKKRKFNIKGMVYYKFHSVKDSHIANGLKNKGKIISQETIKKTKKTLISKYGVDCFLNLKHIREYTNKRKKENAEIRKELIRKQKESDKRSTKEKWLDTIKSKYNVSSYKDFLRGKQNYEDIIKRQQESFKISIKRKYGVDNIRNIPNVKEKIKETCLERYGTTTPLNTKEQKEKKKLKKRIETYYNFSRFKNECVPKFTLKEWMEKFDQKLPWKKTSTGKVYYCKYWGYAPVGKFKDSTLERTVCKMLDSLDVSYVKNTRDVINPMELDLFLPKYNIAIECNGEYFHSTRTKDKDYHLLKNKECFKKGIRLINLFGKDITQKERKVFNLLKTFVKKNKIKIGARKCNIVEISSGIAKTFFEKYHFNGFCHAKNHYGLMYKNRLISAISIGKARFLKNSSDLELIRFATMKNINVLGGFSKFLSLLRKKFPNKTLHTYADLNIYTGDVYEKTGFTFNRLTDPDFYYCKDGNTFVSRYQAQKHKLKNLLKDKFESNLSEEENMKNSEYYRVYGCGNKYYSIIL